MSDQAEPNRRRAAARAKASVKRLVMTMQADRMLTLTYRRNELSAESAWGDFARFARIVRGRYPKWKYCVVAERQGRGAIHFHAALVGWQDVAFLRSAWARAGGDGNIDVRYFKQRGRLPRALCVARYITKYMSKGFADDSDRRELGGHRFRSSRGIEVCLSTHWLRADCWRDAVRETLEHVRQSGVRLGGVFFADDWSVCWACGWEVEPPF